MWPPSFTAAPLFPCINRSSEEGKKRLASAYKPLLINSDCTHLGAHLCTHSASPHKHTNVFHLSNNSKYLPIVATLKEWGGSRRGEASGALTDWMLCCPWRQHMGEEHGATEAYLINTGSLVGSDEA